MTKEELINHVSEKVEDVSKARIREIYDAVFEGITSALMEGDKQRFLVNSFGTFEVKHRAARKGRNPRTKEPLDIPASTTVSFRPAQALKEKLNKGGKKKKGKK